MRFLRTLRNRLHEFVQNLGRPVDEERVLYHSYVPTRSFSTVSLAPWNPPVMVPSHLGFAQSRDTAPATAETLAKAWD